MKEELRNHLIPLALIFFIVSLFWAISKVPYYEYIFLFLGFTIGAFFLDLDHIVYWFFLKPNLEESQTAQNLIKSGKIKKTLKLLEKTHKNHNSMAFHHFFFQAILNFITFFIYFVSHNIFLLSFLLALNLHLLVDEIEDYIYNPKHLQDWLFAREEKQLSLESILYYLILFTILSLFFIILLINSKI